MGILGKLKHRIAIKIALAVRNVEDEINRLTLPKFANQPKNLRFETPRRISNPGCIWIGDDVSLGPGCLLSATRKYPGAFMQGAPENLAVQDFDPVIRIGDRVSTTGYLTIGATTRVEIGDDVLFASHIFIGDSQHGHSDTEVPYKYQPLESIAPVTIGRGCWIGQHVVIMPGVDIGEMSIIGANSVVTKSIPPRCIAVGSPARVIRQWNSDSRSWEAAKAT